METTKIHKFLLHKTSGTTSDVWSPEGIYRVFKSAWKLEFIARINFVGLVPGEP